MLSEVWKAMGRAMGGGVDGRWEGVLSERYSCFSARRYLQVQGYLAHKKTPNPLGP